MRWIWMMIGKWWRQWSRIHRMDVASRSSVIISTVFLRRVIRLRIRWIGRHWDVFLLILLVDNRLEFLEDGNGKREGAWDEVDFLLMHQDEGHLFQFFLDLLKLFPRCW